MTTDTAELSDAAQFEAHIAERLRLLAAREGHRPRLPVDEPVVRKGGRPATPEIEARRVKVLKLARKGLAKTEIAKRLGATYEQIKSDCAALKDRGQL